MLWQLRAAGKPQAFQASSLAKCSIAFRPAQPPDLLGRAILSALSGFDGPIAIGLRSGHVSRQNVTLTFGVEAELNVAEETTLKLLEPAVNKAGNRE